MLNTNSNCSVPAGEYMNPVQKSFFEALLLERLSAARTSIEAAKVGLTNLGVAADTLDQALIEDERRSLTMTLARLDEQVREIRAALRAIADDEYGWCEDTGEEIGLERLMAQPTARFSAVSQAYHEVRNRQFKTA